jgi:hypothetical protein
MEERQDHQQAVPSAATQRVRQDDPRRRVSLSCVLAGVGLLLLGGFLGGAWVHIGVKGPALDAAIARVDQYQQDLAAMRARLDESQNAAAALEARLLVEESTRRGLESSLRAVQTELGQARDTLAFYEELHPPGPSGAVTVRALDVAQAGPHLKYRLLVMRSGGSDKPFRGELKFRAEGTAGGERVVVELRPAVQPPIAPGDDGSSGADAAAPGKTSAESGPDPLTLEFMEFQRSSGLLALPEDFEPSSVTVDVLEGRNLRASRSVDLPGTQ